MRKFDCNSFRITGNTNFKKKLTSFVSKSVWGNPAMKVKVATEIPRYTATAVVFRLFSVLLSDMCSSTWETHIPSHMCSLRGKHISRVIYVPLPGKHITAAWLAQLGERRFAEREVAGSNPSRTNT